MKQLEIACFNLESAVIAQDGGADRIELCENQPLGGTTPALEMIAEARQKIHIPLYIMIRPRGGDFCYNEAELQQMKTAIRQIKALQVDGFVFGVLDTDRRIAGTTNTELVRLAHPLPCTFHRAFDAAPDLKQAVDELAGCGFTTILTSGGAPNVDAGEETLAELVAYAGNRIAIMPGGGLRSTNIQRMAAQTKAVFFHSSAITDTSGIAAVEEVKALRHNLR